MREQFEKLPDIKRKMAMLIKYDADSEMYKYIGVSIDEFYAAKLNFINGAWYAYQEQQKKLNGALDLACKLQYSSGERIYNEIKELLK